MEIFLRGDIAKSHNYFLPAPSSGLPAKVSADASIMRRCFWWRDFRLLILDRLILSLGSVWYPVAVVVLLAVSSRDS